MEKRTEDIVLLPREIGFLLLCVAVVAKKHEANEQLVSMANDFLKQIEEATHEAKQIVSGQA